jgi:hypothetical protein
MRYYVIYFDPLDYRGQYVVRGWTMQRKPEDGPALKPDPEPLAVVGTIEEARLAVPVGLNPFRRDPDDEFQIVETWI